MIEVVHKRKKLTEEERKKRQAENRKTQYSRQKTELAESKALKKKKIPYTAEEKAEKERIRLETVEEKSRELASKKMPMDRMEVMRRIRKIYARGDIEELASKTGICEHWFISWMETNRRPEGLYLKDLQRYFAKH